MKRIVLLSTLLLFAFSMAWAQYSDESEKSFQFEVVAGGNLSNWSSTNSNAKWHPGFHLGVRGTYNFASLEGTPYLNAGLLLSLKGVKSDEVSFNAYYLDVPIHVGYSRQVSEGVNLFGEVGPYLGIGVFGKTAGVNTFDALKRFDVGVGGRIGVEFQHKFNVSFGFDHGLLEVIEDTGFKNMNMTLQLGYKF